MRIIKAIEFAANKHNGQKRKSTGFPYIVHPIIVSNLILKYKGSSKHIEDLQIAGLLHDVLEDTNTTVLEIQKEFGSLVASLVLELTSDKKKIKKDYDNNKNKYLIEKMLLMSNYAFILKLIDRLSNILDNPTEQYMKDTIIMMEELSERRGLTKRQKQIVKDILFEIDLKINQY